MFFEILAKIKKESLGAVASQLFILAPNLLRQHRSGHELTRILWFTNV